MKRFTKYLIISILIFSNLIFAQVVLGQSSAGGTGNTSAGPANNGVSASTQGGVGGSASGADNIRGSAGYKSNTTTKGTSASAGVQNTSTGTSGASTAGGVSGSIDGSQAVEGGSASASVDTSVEVDPGISFDTVLGTFYNPLEFDRPEQLVVRLINALLLLVGIISVIMIILGGMRMVGSAGNESQIKKGRETIIWAVGGLLLSLMAFSIVAIVQSIIS